jgi:hypothetical protein
MSAATKVSLTQKLSLTQIAVLSALMVEARELSNAELTELTGTPLTGEDRVRLVAGGLVEERRVGRSYAFQLSNEGWAQGLAVLAEQAQGKGAAATTVRMLLHGLHRALAARGVDARTFFAGSTLAGSTFAGSTFDGSTLAGSTTTAAPAAPDGATEPAMNGTGAANGTGALNQVQKNRTAAKGGAAPGAARGTPAFASGQTAGRVPQVDTVEQRIRAAYASLATEPAGWVSLADLRERLADIPRAEVDTALKWMAVQPGVRLIPVANQKSLSMRDREAALRFGGEENHAFAIEES